MNILEHRVSPADLALRASKRPQHGDDEVRFVEARFDSVEDGRLRGYAAVFDEEATITDFTEVLRRGTFKKTLSENKDVFAFWNHNSDYVIGRTLNDSLSLEEDERGLRFSLAPADTTWGRDVARLVADGLVDKMSFGFRVIKDAWSERDADVLREIQEVRLYEISPVPVPAYAGTYIEQDGHGRGVIAPTELVHEPEPRRTHSTQRKIRLAAMIAQSRY